MCPVATTDAAGAAWWPVGPDDPTRLPHWCCGTSGIGSFLLRMYAATEEPALGAYAGAAAVAVYRSRWRSLPSACHGLAGDGQYLLDAAQVLGDETYDDWAESLVEAIAVRHCRRGGRLLDPARTGSPSCRTTRQDWLAFSRSCCRCGTAAPGPGWSTTTISFVRDLLAGRRVPVSDALGGPRRHRPRRQVDGTHAKGCLEALSPVWSTCVGLQLGANPPADDIGLRSLSLGEPGTDLGSMRSGGPRGKPDEGLVRTRARQLVIFTDPTLPEQLT